MDRMNLDFAIGALVILAMVAMVLGQFETLTTFLLKALRAYVWPFTRRVSQKPKREESSRKRD
jgi:hypothetical protein